MTIEARTILGPAVAALTQAGIASARQDARLLLGFALGRDSAVLPHEDVRGWTGDLDRLFQTYVARRVVGEPVSRIRGWREFWSLNFELSAATLDPRPDSEILVERAIAYGKERLGDGRDHGRDQGLRLLDTGTGSGCLLLACLSELPLATGLGIDINPDAIDMAAHNAGALGLTDRATFAVADFTASMEGFGCFDIILSNPPYIPSAQIATLSSEVAVHDPLLALDGGQDGLDCWRRLMPEMAKLLSARGHIFVEIGDGQGADVTALASAAGLSAAGVFADLSGTQRCLVFTGGANHEVAAKMPDA
jgi:release factor glutamine methyltransferase